MKSSSPNSIAAPQTMALVIDASIALGLCFEDLIDATVLQAVETLRTHQAIVTSLCYHEIASTLLDAERKRRISAPDSRNLLELWKALQPEIDNADTVLAIDQSLLLAHEHELHLSEACTLELALRRKAPLATRSKELQRAAKRLGILLVI